MKKFLFFIALMNYAIIFSQETTVIKQETVNIDDKIYENADKNPEYPGGIDAFRKKFFKNLDIMKVSGEGFMNSEAQFVISKEGKIINIIALGINKSLNDELKRAIRATTKVKWTPAEVNGQPVNFKVKLPVSINIPYQN